MLRQANLLFGRRLPATRCLLSAGETCNQLTFGSRLVAKQGLSLLADVEYVIKKYFIIDLQICPTTLPSANHDKG